MSDENLKLLRPITWEEIFSVWRENEDSLDRWVEYYKSRGFSSWQEWRQHTLQSLDCASLDWQLFEISNPIDTVPTFYAGPFRSWIDKFYNGKKMEMFKELVRIPEIQNQPIINQIVENFPAQTMLFGLKTKEGIVILEGLKRCCAIALANEREIEIKTNLTIALANFDGVIPTLGSEGAPT